MRTRRKGLAFLLLLALLTGGGGAWSQESVESRLQRLERRVSIISDLVLQVEGLKRVNRELLGRVETLEYRLQKLEEKQRELYLDLDQRISALQRDQGPAVPRADETAATPADTGMPPAAPGKAGEVSKASRQVQQEYDAAYTLLQPARRDYKKAIAAFREFIERHPRTDLTDNAYYWLGETYYVTGDNDAALASFDALLQQFPDSEKVPGALLKKGYILQAKGRKEEARKVFRQLVRNYPDASVARMAKRRLQQLK